MAIAGRTSDSFQSGNTAPHKGLKNMLDLEEVISELKAVITQQNKLLELLSKNTINGCVFSNVQQTQPQPNNTFGHPSYGGIKLMNNAAHCGHNPLPGFVFNGSFNGPSNNQSAVNSGGVVHLMQLPVWNKPVIQLENLMQWPDLYTQIPKEYKLGIANGALYRVPPTVLVADFADFTYASDVNFFKSTQLFGWIVVGEQTKYFSEGTLIHRTSSHSVGLIYRKPGVLYPDPVNKENWF